ncbi:hypothetical protein TIFTF001_031761 [Ficus carica]|uniref:Putative plant transposon protein domain-containing protein n=1 Tax=Ficus carica TaxID=3494 RepID=A0AA88DX54_FICCA|nr:hypothetical protein TIFTF001_031761 [Ficus carica]
MNPAVHLPSQSCPDPCRPHLPTNPRTPATRCSITQLTSPSSNTSRYENFIFEQSFCPEKGFLLQDTPIMGYDEFIHLVITKHKWRQFCSHPTVAVMPIVREFYNYLIKEGQKMVYVCGVKVPIDKDTINRFYGLEGAEDWHTAFTENVDETQLQTMLEHICVEGYAQNISAQGAMTILRNNLTPQFKVWYHFLKTHLMSSIIVQTVSKDRVVLLESIILGRPIDCVSVFDTKEWLSSKGAITTIAIARIMQIKVNKGNQEQPPNDEEEQDPVPQPTASRNATSSNNRGSILAELTQSLKMLEQ